MKLLLDTHACVWWMLGHDRLTAEARRAIEDASVVWLSAASGWEITTKVRLGKWPEAAPLIATLPSLLESQRFGVLGVSLGHAMAAGTLGGVHRDPFDRMLIAQALAEGLTIVSVDRVFDDYGVPRIG